MNNFEYSSDNVIRIALQKSGRLSDESLNLIRDCGIKVSRADNRLKSPAANFPLEILYLRDDDIPEYVSEGVADIGIVGENLVVEKRRSVNVSRKLGFSKCRVSLAIPKDIDYPGLSYFDGKTIACSYPQTLRSFLDEGGIDATIHEISGSTEIAPGIGLADAICDIVSSGSTLMTNGLKEVATVFRSEAVLIQNQDIGEEKEALLRSMLFRIDSVLRARNAKYILLNAPDEKIDEITALLPGLKSPTIVPLHDRGWSAVHAVIREDDFWNVIHGLEEAGAEGILVFPIEKMIGVSQCR